MLASLQCSSPNCSEDAVQALLNDFGWLHLRCALHVGGQPSNTRRLIRIPEYALEHVRPLGVLVMDGSKTIEIPMPVALALYVMHG